MPVIETNSDHKIDIIDQHFKISAGPGSGKTHWLANHIKHVLNNSNKLSSTRKVACITYTNIAVETIQKRLGSAISQVEVSTIHSFLYKHIIKPYISFISDAYSIDISKIDGHDEIKTNFQIVNEWINNHPNKNQLSHPYSINQLTRLPNNKTALINWLDSISYELTTNNITLSLDNSKAFYMDNGSRRYLNNKCLSALNENLIDYKKLYWEKGKISHDDILFFSYQLLTQFPYIIEVLSHKFPYFFVDEFQDSNPIQIDIFKKLGLNNIITGVIGDPAQSIYEFQGANYNQINNFTLPNIQHYTFNENRRSSNEIIDVLKSIRTDIEQINYRNISINKPIIYVGDMIIALETIKKEFNEMEIQTLSRNNFTSNILKANVDGSELDQKALENLLNTDSNRARKYIMYFSIKAIAYAHENKFKDAFKILEKCFSNEYDKMEKKRKSLVYLSKLLNDFNSYEDSSLIEFSEYIRDNFDFQLPKVSSGKVKTFYENHSLTQMLICVSIPEDLSLHKTIHKAKGDEFQNVLLVLKKPEDINFLITPNIQGNEEHRIYYVAVSRAKNNLAISIPSLTEENKNKLSNYFHIEYI